jgi:hypothetical protein
MQRLPVPEDFPGLPPPGGRLPPPMRPHGVARAGTPPVARAPVPPGDFSDWDAPNAVPVIADPAAGSSTEPDPPAASGTSGAAVLTPAMEVRI